MSLKTFHIIFITAASLMLFGFGGWLWRQYRGPEGTTGDLAWAIVAFAVGVGLSSMNASFSKNSRT